VQIEELHKISPEIRETLDAYLDEYADRIVTGFDITDLTLRELPQFVMSIIASQLDSTQCPTADVKISGAEEKLRLKVPANHRSEFDQGLEEARSAYGLHDEDVRITYLWPLGLIRRAVLVAADRLVSRGALRSAEDGFELAPDELSHLLAGGSSPTAEEISERSAEWRDWARDEPPAAYGEREPGVPEHLLSPAAARVSAAFNFYLAEMEARAKPSSQGSWSVLVEGLAASPGRYEGKARIVRGPADFGKLSGGDVLVARTISPAFNIILPIIGGVVTDRGGALCHAAIVAREFGIPAVVGTNHGTAKIPDGAQVLVDGDRGFVTVRI
jgi:pyruvate,water dikinase